MKTLVAITAALLVLSVPLFPQGQASEETRASNLNTIACSEYLQMVGDDEDREQVWTVFAFGYYSGLRSPDLDIEVSREVYLEFKDRLVAACQTEPTRLFAVAISEIKDWTASPGRSNAPD